MNRVDRLKRLLKLKTSIKDEYGSPQEDIESATRLILKLAHDSQLLYLVANEDLAETSLNQEFDKILDRFVNGELKRNGPGLCVGFKRVIFGLCRVLKRKAFGRSSRRVPYGRQ